MTLDDLERQNSGFYGFVGDFGLRDTFQKRIAPKSIKIGVVTVYVTSGHVMLWTKKHVTDGIVFETKNVLLLCEQT